MEKAVISYGKGLTTSPSDLICSDGELAECVNLEVKNEELVPMEMPIGLGFSLSEGEHLLLIHNTKVKDKNYITIKDNTIKAFSVIGNDKDYYDFSQRIDSEIKSISSLGNTIVVYTNTDVYYFLFSEDNYKFLGNNLPEINVAFKLDGNVVYSEESDITVTSSDIEDNGSELSVDIASIVSKFVNEEATEKNKFVYPFFIRYALRLFDGSNVMHSAPILMTPGTNYMPNVFWNSTKYGIHEGSYKVKAGMIASKLVMDVLNSEELNGWNDVVSGVDVYVSSPIITYDFNATTFYGERESNSGSEGENSRVANNIYTGVLNGEYSRWNINTVLSQREEGFKTVSFGKKQVKVIDEEICSTSLFYQYSFIEISKISKSESIIVDGFLGGLETGLTLKDDYLTHCKLIANNAFVYNGRLNITDVSKFPFNGFSLQSMCNLPFGESSSSDYYKYTIYTYIRKSDGSTNVVKSEESPLMILQGKLYLFYPDTDAYKMVIVSDIGSYYSVELSEHPFLNGAYALYEFTSPYQGTLEIAEDYTHERMYNKLLLSNVNNPFYFPLEGYYTVGSDRIIGMGAITRPISQGQFGEFPLIVFCSDGNYAMRVDEQGFYASISPVQEDVVLGSDKITSMENSLVVITKKGIMLTSGGEMNKVASQMDGAMIMASSLNGIGTSVSELSNLVSKSSDDMGFLSYVYGSRMAFDYASNRLLVYNPEKTYSYVYDFNNDTISKLVINGGRKIVASVLDYPDTIIQDDSGAMYSLYTKDDISTKTGRQYGFALTRPLKMGAALNLKSVKQVMHLTSNCGNGSYVKYILYGSNDNATYYRVSSRFGKPYKYYRIAIYTHLLPKESLSGSAITTEERRTHKLR